MSEVKPFLKWAGGKRQLLGQLRPFYPERFHRYWEPFVGSGAVFFDLWNLGRLQAQPAVLSDANADLVRCYATVRDHVDAVIEALKTLQRRHERDARATFYEVRKRFNDPPACHGAGAAADPVLAIDRAAMLIYLNRTGFNGLFRRNARGAFNVPMGRYANPTICDTATLQAVSRVLASPMVEVRCGSFESVLEGAAVGDFVYLDPPYAPVSATASFTAYTPDRFSPAHQQRLQEVVVDLSRRGCTVLLSNSSAAEVERLYGAGSDARQAGLRTVRVQARRAINSNAARRRAVVELVVTNRE